MRKLPKFLVCSILVVCLIIPLNAYAFIIYDNYYGADDHGWGDRIGPLDFEIYSMAVSIVGSTMNVDIYTSFNQPGPFSGDPYNLEVYYGDLFISIDGWHPNTDSPYYLADNHHNNGETWEYAFDVDTGDLYDITDHQGAILLSDDVISSGWVFRNGQEVLIDPNELGAAVSTGGSTNDAEAGIYSLQIALGSLDWDLSDLGFHWTMTCGNDVIEGTAPAPEPATMLSFSWGLIGLAVVGRKKFFKQG